MYQAVIFSFKVLQNFIVYESAEDRNLRAFLNRVKNSLSCNIFTKLYCIVTGMPYLPAKMNLFPWTVFLSKGFENGINQRFLTGDYMVFGSISLFAGFLEEEKSLETLIVIFEKVSPKGFLWLNMKNFEISVLTANSRYS